MVEVCSDECIPPDEYKPIKCNCENCKFYLTFISKEQADTYIKYALENKFPLTKPDIFFEFPKNINELMCSDIDVLKYLHDKGFTSDNDMLSNLILIKQYVSCLNPDYLSQVISLSSVWRQLMDLYLVNNSSSYMSMYGGGGSSCIYWQRLPFEELATDLDIVKKILLQYTIINEGLFSQYEIKEICVNCMTQDLNENSILDSRQKKCHLCGANVDRAVKPENRLARCYYSSDKASAIDYKDLTVYSVGSWHLKRSRRYHKMKIEADANKHKNK